MRKFLNKWKDLINKPQNPGHTNWHPRDHPESLLLEIESGIMIREVQEQIAAYVTSPSSGKNVVMQLNMGEGKVFYDCAHNSYRSCGR